MSEKLDTTPLGLHRALEQLLGEYFAESERHLTGERALTAYQLLMWSAARCDLSGGLWPHVVDPLAPTQCPECKSLGNHSPSCSVPAKLRAALAEKP